MRKIWVLDSFAVLALVGGEEGSAEVAGLFEAAAQQQGRLLMTWINVGEVAYIVERRWGAERFLQILVTLESAGVEFIEVDRDLALAAAHLKAKHPLAYADTFAAALARQTNATLVTGDPEFKLLEETITIHWL